MTGWILVAIGLILGGPRAHRPELARGALDRAPGRTPAGALTPGRHRHGRLSGGRADRRVDHLAGVCAAAVVAATWWPLGVALAPVAAVLVVRGVRLLHGRRGEEAAAAERTDPRAVALLLDLVAGALNAGLPVDGALIAVADCVDGPAGPFSAAAEPLRRVGRLLSLGAEAGMAWVELEALPSYRPVAAAGRRCAHSGARLAGALRSAAEQLRQEHHEEAVARAERCGVWVLLPLGLCFLPAFVCIGIVPVIVGVAQGVGVLAGIGG